MAHVAPQMTKKDIQVDRRPLQSLLKVLRFEVCAFCHYKAVVNDAR